MYRIKQEYVKHYILPVDLIRVLNTLPMSSFNAKHIAIQ